MMAVTGHEATGPTRAGVTAVDLSTGVTAAFAVASALFRRETTGEGQHIDTSMLDTALTMLTPLIAGWQIGGRVPELLGNKGPARSEEHTSELQSLMRSTYAVIRLKKKNTTC